MRKTNGVSPICQQVHVAPLALGGMTSDYVGTCLEVPIGYRGMPANMHSISFHWTSPSSTLLILNSLSPYYNTRSPKLVHLERHADANNVVNLEAVIAVRTGVSFATSQNVESIGLRSGVMMRWVARGAHRPIPHQP